MKKQKFDQTTAKVETILALMKRVADEGEFTDPSMIFLIMSELEQSALQLAHGAFENRCLEGDQQARRRCGKARGHDGPHEWVKGDVWEAIATRIL